MGRLIGPKTWDRIVRNSWGFFPPSVTAQKLGVVWVFLFPEFLALNHVFVWKKAENGP